MGYELLVDAPNLSYQESVAEKPDVQKITEIVEQYFGERISVSYGQFIAVSDRCAVSCTMSDILTGRSITRVAECVNGQSENLSVESVYQKAFLKSASAFLGLEIRKIEDKEPLIQDEEVILFGNLKGRSFGEAKDTPQFMHFLEQLSGAGGIHFPDKEREEQMKKFLKLAEELLETEEKKEKEEEAK